MTIQSTLLTLSAIIMSSLFAGLLPSRARSEPPEPDALKMQLSWPDRRAIGRIFLSNAGFRTVDNPSGYLDAKQDVLTDEGLARFRKRLLAEADRCIENLLKSNAQGAIVWDLEGYEFPGLVYTGDPRLLATLAPWMDRYADEFFAKFKNAGLRTGVCIRPNHIFAVPPASQAKWGKWGYIAYREKGIALPPGITEETRAVFKGAEKDPAAEISDRIRYAKERWGCTLFYMDTNYFDKRQADGTAKSVLMTPEMIKRITGDHPDILLLPEHENIAYYQFSTPYAQPPYDALLTDDIRERVPGAFVALALEERQAAHRWSEFVNAVVKGDIVFTDPQQEGGPTALATRLYREAELRREQLVGDSPSGLSGDNPAARLRALDTFDAKPEAQVRSQLAKLASSDPEWVVRRAALLPLAQAGGAKAVSLFKEWISEPNDPIGIHAAAALGRAGSEALPVLREIVSNTADENRVARERALVALAAIDTVESHEVSLLLLGDKYTTVRHAALDLVQKRLQKFPTRSTYDALLAMRARPINENIYPRIAAAVDTLHKSGIGSSDEYLAVVGRRDIFDLWTDWIGGGNGGPIGPMPEKLAEHRVGTWRKLAADEANWLKLPAPATVNSATDMTDLLALAQDPDLLTRYHAVRKLIRTNDSRAAEPLAAILQNEKEAPVQRILIEAIHRLGDASVYPSVKRVADDSSSPVQLFAVSALKARER